MLDRNFLSHRLVGLLFFAALLGAGCVPEDNASSRTTDKAGDGVKLDVVKFAQLEKAIQAQRGKIVVVDMWGEFCVPCKREFPNLVKLHEKHAKDGVVCMSVSVDPAKKQAAALAFLQAKGATFTNYLLDDGDGIFDRWDFTAVPAVFVFDKEGKRVGKFTRDDPDQPYTYADVVKLVEKLLAPAP